MNPSSLVLGIVRAIGRKYWVMLRVCSRMSRLVCANASFMYLSVWLVQSLTRLLVVLVLSRWDLWILFDLHCLLCHGWHIALTLLPRIGCVCSSFSGVFSCILWHRFFHIWCCSVHICWMTERTQSSPWFSSFCSWTFAHCRAHSPWYNGIHPISAWSWISRRYWCWWMSGNSIILFVLLFVNLVRRICSSI